MMLDRMKVYTKKCFEQLLYIQKRMRDKTNTKGAKVDVINNMWDQILYRLANKAIKANDAGMKFLLKQI